MCFAGYKTFFRAVQKHAWVGSLITRAVLPLNGAANRYGAVVNQLIKSGQQIHDGAKIRHAFAL